MLCNNTHMNTLNWDDLRYFLILVQQGTLSASARVLDVEHSTIARRIRQLEDSLGKPLFNRLPRGWQLTEEGELLQEQAQHLEDHMLRIQRTLSSLAPLSGEVRIAMPPLLSTHLMLPHLSQLHTKYPDIQLVLMGDMRKVDLLKGEADIAIRIGEPDVLDVFARRLGHLNFSWYMKTTGEKIPLYSENSELPAPPYIGLTNEFPNTIQKIWLDNWIDGCKCALRVNDFLSLLSAIGAGWGMSILPDYLGQHEASVRRLNCKAEMNPPSAALYLLIHPDVKRVKRVQLVADEITSIFLQGGLLDN